MNDIPIPDCPWAERVSAMVDGEIRVEERPLVEAHASGCGICTMIMSDTSLPTRELSNDRVSAILDVIPDRLSPTVRGALVIVGAMILAASAPDFVRGNTMGDALHDLRHLAIWQVSIGVAVLTAAVTFRLSRLVTVMLATFLGLTVAAASYDVMTGHRGPWTDLTHIGEVVAVLLVLRLVWPQARLKTLTRRADAVNYESPL